MLSTVHSAKGKEWDVVFLIWAADGFFPLARAAEDPDELEEERRLMYVAMTRARNELLVGYPLHAYPTRYAADYSLVLGMSVPDVSGAAIANLEVETLQHKFPTFHGDTIHAETRVLDVKESSSRPDRGVVTVESKGFNQDGKEVCYFRRRVMVWKRDAAPDRARPYDEATAWD